MESAHREILTRLRSDIINDVDVNNGIINPLSTEYILREEDVNNIRAGKTKPEQAGILLDILPRYTHLHVLLYVYLAKIYYKM